MSNLQYVCLSMISLVTVLVCSNAQLLQYLFSRESRIDGKLFDVHLLDSYNKVSNAQCMMQCFRARKCLVYIYDLADRYCALHHMTFPILKTLESTETPTAIAYKLSK